jgi:hypothetical protein
MPKYSTNLDEALYATNRAIFEREDACDEEGVEVLQTARDMIWDLIVKIDPSRKD